MRIPDGNGSSGLPPAGKPPKPHHVHHHHHHHHKLKKAGQAKAGARGQADADQYGDADDAPVFSGVGRTVEMKGDGGSSAGFSPRDLQLGGGPVETGWALALGFEHLARHLSHSNGHGFVAFLRQAEGKELTPALVRAALKLDSRQPLRVEDVTQYVMRRLTLQPELTRDWKKLIDAMKQHLNGIMLAEVGLQPSTYFLLVGLGPDGTLAGLRTRSR